MNSIELAPSILSADFSKLGAQVSEIEKAGCQWLHIDIMDGMFVPSISFGAPVFQAIRKDSGLLFDVHMMVEEPGRFVETMAAAGADMITVHQEACKHLDRTIQQIHACGKLAGVALNPATSISTLENVLQDLDMVLIMTVNPGFGGQSYIPAMTKKIKAMAEQIKEVNPAIRLEVDGGIKADNVHVVLEAGADTIVAGSAVFNQDITGSIKAFTEQFK